MMNNFMMGPMDRMQHQGGFAPNQPPQMPMGGSPMGGQMGPSPEILQRLMAMFAQHQNQPQGLPFNQGSGMPQIGQSKPPMANPVPGLTGMGRGFAPMPQMPWSGERPEKNMGTTEKNQRAGSIFGGGMPEVWTMGDPNKLGGEGFQMGPQMGANGSSGFKPGPTLNRTPFTGGPSGGKRF